MRLPRTPSASLAAALAGVLAALLVTTAPGLTRPASAADESDRLLSAANAARRAAGLPAYGVSAELVAEASAHSARMAAQQRLYHDATLRHRVANWVMLGDNVGYGPDSESIHRAFLASPSHRANILDRGFAEVGIGTARDGSGQLWVTEIFRRPA